MTHPKIRVYIASPYRNGDVAVNVKRQIDTANELMDHGFVPYAPLLSHFQHMAHPRPDQDWLDNDIEWLGACNVVLRLPGESEGADREVRIARGYQIQVFSSIKELEKWVKKAY